VLDTLEKVRQNAENNGTADIADARGTLHALAVRVNDWALGGICQTQCYSLTEHHGIEDNGIFPHLRRSDPGLAPVLDRLDAEHHAIHDLLKAIDSALVHLVRRPGEHTAITELLALLRDTILSHFAYEEQELLPPLSRFGFYAGQL
jgi:iron-sulfur cluster repair protein YtfE (RIC family)